MFRLNPLPRHLAAAVRDAADGRGRVRRSAVSDLARIAAADDDEERRAAIAAIEAVLAEDGDAAVRAAAAVALADAGARDAVPCLLKALDDPHPEVRQFAILALGEVGPQHDPTLVVRVRQFLTAGEPALRHQAVLAVAQLAPDDAVEVLEAALRDDDPEIRYLALRVLEERSRERGEAPPVDHFRAALDDDDAGVAVAAAIALGSGGDAAGARHLVAVAARQAAPRAPEDEQAALELCGELGLNEAIPGLQRRCRGFLGLGLTRDRFEYSARVALARLGDERAVAAIMRGLEARDRDTRTVAVAAAGDARLLAARPVLEAMVGNAARAEPEAVKDALGKLRAG